MELGLTVPPNLKSPVVSPVSEKSNPAMPEPSALGDIVPPLPPLPNIDNDTTVVVPPILIEPSECNVVNGVFVPIPTFPLSNTTIEPEAFAFSTLNDVVADVVPDPLTNNELVAEPVIVKLPENLPEPVTVKEPVISELVFTLNPESGEIEAVADPDAI